MKLHLSSSKALLLLMLGAGLAISAVPAVAAPAAPLPPEHSVGNVTYLSGGIGKDEAAAMKQAAAHYPLEVMFLAKEKDRHDAYKAGDTVKIWDHSGKIVLDTQIDGPILLAKLPPGKYKVEAIDRGRTEERTVSLDPDKHARLNFEWKGMAETSSHG